MCALLFTSALAAKVCKVTKSTKARKLAIKPPRGLDLAYST